MANFSSAYPGGAPILGTSVASASVSSATTGTLISAGTNVNGIVVTSFSMWAQAIGSSPTGQTTTMSVLVNGVTLFTVLAGGGAAGGNGGSSAGYSPFQIASGQAVTYSFTITGGSGLGAAILSYTIL